MEVSWEHPKAQRPENGYRLVFAPFADVIDQKPWIEVVDGDTNTVSFTFPHIWPEVFDWLALELRAKPPFTVKFVKKRQFSHGHQLFCNVILCGYLFRTNLIMMKFDSTMIIHV